MKHLWTTIALAMMAGTTCAHTPPATPASKTVAKEGEMMNTSTDPKTTEWEARPIHPSFTAEKALKGVLALLRENASFADFTPAKIDAAMEVKGAPYGKNEWGFGTRISTDWGGGYELDSSPRDPRFSLLFMPRIDLAPGKAMDATQICQIDFETFKAEVEAMGFSGTPEWGNPNHLIGYFFEKEGYYVRVSLQAESMARLDHDCIMSLTIHP